ncbi:hypothetical protein BM1374166_01841 [Bartonella tribocorum]|uniref:Uncharacterized protein n=1 Tax=Bartonella kosoyi TaxID=2133959 RepID=A0A5B9CYM4_9HYPH|nr:hypothetical protein D1093_09195 [Bartonella kosoyi]CDO49487.1 hypothetical protein BM1374166_01841 [Bartonella tribocorum]
MSKLQIGKSALFFLLLWLRGPVIVILSTLSVTSFITLVGLPIAIHFTAVSRSISSLIYPMFLLFIVSFGSFLLIFCYETLIRFLR